MARTSFNQEWAVAPKVSPFAQLMGGTAAPKKVFLPHDAIITLPRSADAPSAGRTGYFPGGAFAYSKSFDVPEAWQNKRVSLEFDGVYRDAMVYVNGTFAAQRPNGYSPFRVALDPYLRYGQANTIVVEARAHDDSRWYTGAGIYRDVTLSITDLVHIRAKGIRVSTPDIDDERAVVEVTVPVINESIGTRTVRVRNTIIRPDGKRAAHDSSPITLRAGAEGLVRQRLYVESPKRWSVESPELYTICTEIDENGILLEDEATTIGIRSIQLDPRRGLRLNGQSVKLRGACIHHDNGLLGAASIGRAEERRIELLKEAGFNAIRSSHNPVSPAMLDACDRLGMLVMDETFDMWTQSKSSFDYSLSFPEWWERDVEALIDKDFNHPSVIFYSIGNEIFETGDPLGGEWGRALAERVRTLDPTRLVTNGINPFVSVLQDVATAIRGAAVAGAADTHGGVNEAMNTADFMEQLAAAPFVTERTEASFSVLDVAGMNYSDARYELDQKRFPSRVIVGSETHGPRIAHNWRLVSENAYVLGDFTWTGWDYLGEVGIGRVRYDDETPEFEAPYPWISAQTGDIDITGHRRSISYYREIVFGLRSEPYIAVLRPENHGRTIIPGMWAWSDSISSWTWDTVVGSPITVDVYSDADEIELVLNDHVIARTAVGETIPFVAAFELTYVPGTLRATAYRDGVAAEQSILTSAGAAACIAVTADRAHLRADHNDLSYVTIEIHDDHGALVTAQDTLIHASLDGPGVLQALGSARPDTNEPYHGTHTTTFDGRALAIVRPTGPGTITLSVTAETLGSASTILHADAGTDALPVDVKLEQVTHQM